jgi:hypothetical protein
MTFSNPSKEFVQMAAVVPLRSQWSADLTFVVGAEDSVAQSWRVVYAIVEGPWVIVMAAREGHIREEG